MELMAQRATRGKVRESHEGKERNSHSVWVLTCHGDEIKVGPRPRPRAYYFHFLSFPFLSFPYLRNNQTITNTTPLSHTHDTLSLSLSPQFSALSSSL